MLLSAGCNTVSHDNLQARTTAEQTQPSPQPQSLTPGGEAVLRSLLDAAQLPDLEQPNFSSDRAEAEKFYQTFGGSLPWIRQGRPTSQAIAIIRALQNADREGLLPGDYDGPLWNQRLAELERVPTPESDWVRFDLALTISAMRYVSDLHIGRVNPRQFHYDLEIDHTKFNLSGFLCQRLVAAQDVDGALESAEPPFPLYRRTKVALRKYAELLQRDGGGGLPTPAKPVRPGDSYAGVPRLASLLALVGDIPSEGQHADNLYRGDLVDGVKRFQQRHGIDSTGLIDATTLRELNTPLSQRVEQLVLTMERLRWLPHEFGRPPIVVNIPEFRLHATDEQYHWALSMNVVVGKAYGHHETPVFSSEIKSVIFRPYWNVPESITRAELLPHIKKDSHYLADNDYEIVDRSGEVVSEGAVDSEIESRLRSGDLRVRQRPGPKDALGLIKFDVPSSYDVYLHSTPLPELFSKSRRDFSHGCIRVEKPAELAGWVFQGMPAWTEDRIEAAMNGDRTFEVKLDRPVPLLIVYGTAVVMEDGEVHFFDDIYRYDADLERALGSLERGADASVTPD
jgi:murein L,D-transpeptidase YcbB/YkuD